MRHAVFQRSATYNERHVACVIGEVDSGLAGRIPGTNEMNIETLSRAHLAARRAVVDAFANKLVQALDGEPTPRDPCRKNESTRLHDLVPVKKHFTRRRVYARDRTGHKNLRSQPLGLLQRAACKLITRDAARKSEVVFNSGGCSSLPARSLAFDDHSAQTFRRAIDRRSKSRRTAADHYRVVCRKLCAGLKTKQSRKVACLRLLEFGSIGEP